MYISAHSSQSADFRIIFQVEDRRYVLPSVYNYSIINNIKNMWTAGIEWVSMIILIALGFMPYARLMFLMSSWVLPRKNTILNKLVRFSNDLGKFAFADTFICTVLGEVLYFSISTPASERVKKDSIQLAAYLIPLSGFYIYFMATILSIVLNHIMLSKYDQIYKEETGLVDVHMKGVLELKKTIQTIQFENKTTTRAKLSILFNILLVVGAVLMAVGVLLPSFMFRSTGVFGALRESIGQDTTLRLSHLSHLYNMPNYVINHSHYTIPLLQIAYGVTFVVPFLFVSLLLVLWFVPLKRRARESISFIVTVKSAWTGIEIFTLTSVIAVLSVQPFSKWMITPQCEPYQPLFDVLFGGMRCYDVIPSFGTLSPIILTGSLLFFVVVKILFFILNKVVKEENDMFSGYSLYTSIIQDEE